MQPCSTQENDNIFASYIVSICLVTYLFIQNITRTNNRAGSGDIKTVINKSIITRYNLNRQTKKAQT